MEEKILAGILFLAAAGCFWLSWRSFREKGFLFNNAWLYASEKERKTMNKTPHYRQSAVVFLLIGLIFLANGLQILLEMARLFHIAAGLAGITVLYAVLSGIMIGKKEKEQKK